MVVDAGSRILIDSCECSNMQLAWDAFEECVREDIYFGGVDLRLVDSKPTIKKCAKTLLKHKPKWTKQKIKRSMSNVRLLISTYYISQL